MRPSIALSLFVLAFVGVAELGAQSPPPCTAPAPLFEPFSCEPAVYIVVLQRGSDLNATIASFQARYGVTPIPERIFERIGAFAIRLTAQQVALLRCEPVVRAIEPNSGFCRPEDPCPQPPSSGPCPAPAALSIPTLGDAGRWLLAAMLAIAAALVLHR